MACIYVVLQDRPSHGRTAHLVLDLLLDPARARSASRHLVRSAFSLLSGAMHAIDLACGGSQALYDEQKKILSKEDGSLRLLEYDDLKEVRALFPSPSHHSSFREADSGL